MKNNRYNHIIHVFLMGKKRSLSLGTAVFVAFAAICGNFIPVLASQPETDVMENAPVSESADEPKASAASIITSIESLPAQDAERYFEGKPALEEILESLPKELSVSLDDAASPVLLPVTWECNDDYENTEFDTYSFTPIWDTDVYSLSPSPDTSPAIPYVTVYVQQAASTVRLVEPEEAESSFSSLAKQKDIYALIYLCDSYGVKQQPGKNAATIVTAPTGQPVQITGVEEDSLYNIWYQVRMDMEGTVYTGYVERAYLAYSDEDLLAWEDRCIQSQPQAYRRNAPAALGIPMDIQQFPSSYQSGLLDLKTQHPNWIFVRMNTDVDWNTSVQEENKQARSLISSRSNAAWKQSPFDSSWSYPTDGILAYYMDPRNFLTEKYIFQFEFLSYNETYHTDSAVQSMLSGTFMSGAIPGDATGQTYAQAFCSIARKLDVSPFHLASRVRQEQGDGASPLISGTHPSYPGVYNYFNIGATGKGSAEVIENGLKKAREYGWTTRYLSLEGGANIISKDYIRKGQNTLYLQKFNVSKTSSAGLYQHQYMQNIAAPSSEAVSVQKAYAEAGSLGNPFVFCIPVYNSMPGSACGQPAQLKEVTLNKSTLSLKVDASAALAASIDGKSADASTVSFSSSNTDVATVAADGTVTAVSAGTAVISCTISGGTTASCTVTVSKTDPAYTTPVPAAVVYSPGQTLADIPLPAGWAWDNPAAVPTVGNQGYPATFTPSDTGKYNTIRKNIALAVSKGTPAYTIPSGLQAAAGSTLATLPLPTGFVWESPSTILKEGTFSYTASYNPDEANYETVTGISIPVTATAKNTACTAHSYQSAITKEATETENGIRTYTCTQCGDTYTETIDKLPPTHEHNYASATTTPASCTQPGILTYTCACGDSYTEAIPATGHNYVPEVTKEATGTENGIRTYTCSQCQDTYTETIAKLPSNHTHSYTSAVTKQPSCTEKGSKTFTCSCGDRYSEEISPLGHNMSGGKCLRCGYREPENNPQAGSGTSQGSSPTASASPSTAGGKPSGTDSSAAGSNPSGTTASNTDSKPSGTNSSAAGSNPSGTGSSVAGSNSLGTTASTTDSKPSGTTASTTDSKPSGANSSAAGSKASGTTPSVAGSNPSDTNSSVAGSNLSGANSSTAGNKPSGTSPSTAGGKPTAENSANRSTITIDMKDTSVLYEETISRIRGQDIDVVLNMGNSISWLIHGENIVADEANGIDMGITLNAGNVPKALLEQAAALSGTGIAMEISLSHDGGLDFQPMLIVSTAVENAGRIANLYYYNPSAGQLEFVDETEIAENGDICFTFSHASDYVIIINETVLYEDTVIASDTAGKNMEHPETATAGASQAKSPEKPSPFLKPSTIFIIIFIIILLASIACTAFFLLRSGKNRHTNEEEEGEDEDEELDDEEDDYYEPTVHNPAGGSSRHENYFYDDDEFDGFE